MPKKDLEQFWQILSEDLMLQRQLQSEPDLTSLVDEIINLGADYGYCFTREEVQEYLGISHIQPVKKTISENL